ncbi:MAG: hypothetical protein QOI40_4050 [Alphaproteobacteria bacterium]|nr:hypothetical protein [Alphaproteobacteria bacterium]
MQHGKLELTRPDEDRPLHAVGTRPRALRTIARRLGLGLLILAGTFVVVVIATARSGDRGLWPPAPGRPATEIFIVNHGYHSGIVVPRRSLAAQASGRGLNALGTVATRFDGFDRLEIGWGDEHFYREVPTVESLTVALAVRALLRPGNPSVLHVVGIDRDPAIAFPNSDLVRLELGEAGFDRLADKLDASFARDRNGILPEPLGPGLYGTSLFFRATGAFHIFNVCNHWTANLLDAAGVPTTPVLATFPFGLLLDLEWRSGLVRLPRATVLKP